MKSPLLLLFFLIVDFISFSQQDNIDSLTVVLETLKNPSPGLESLDGLTAIRGTQQSLARAFLGVNKNDQAERLYLEIAPDSANSKVLGNELKAAFYSDLSVLYSRKKDFKKALMYQKRWKTLSDKILNESTDSKLANIEAKYQIVKKDRENLSLTKQNMEQALFMEKEKNQQLAIFGSLAVALVGLGILFITNRKNEKQKREIERQKKLVEDLQRELHHRLKNNLSFIDFFITLAKGKFPDLAYQEKLDELQNRIKSMFEVHKQLSQKDDLTQVDTKNFISALVQNVKKSYERPNVIFRENIEETYLRPEISFPIGLIVNEFVTNSYKHAFPDGKDGRITIDFNERPTHYYLRLTDTGKGLPENLDIDNLDSFGLETIKLLTQEYHGTFKLDGSNGVKIEITFPKQ